MSRPPSRGGSWGARPAVATAVSRCSGAAMIPVGARLLVERLLAQG
ncbi:hypothetical protein ACJ7VE_14595 [Streptomyces sp. PB17]